MNVNEILSIKKDKKTLKIKGIYFLINKDEIVYIGKSIDVISRIKSHESYGEIIFDHYSYEEKKDLSSAELSEYEKQLIYEINPKDNKSYNIDHMSKKDGKVNIKTKISKEQADFLIKLSIDKFGKASINDGLRILIQQSINKSK